MLALQYGDSNHVTLSCKRPIADNKKIHTKTTEENNSSLKRPIQAKPKEAKGNSMVDQNNIVNTKKSEEVNNNAPKEGNKSITAGCKKMPG